jgi:hypothetical protein
MKRLQTRLRVGVPRPMLLAMALMSAVAVMSSDTRAGTPTYSIDFHVISAAGSALHSDCYRLSGTVGQAAPGYSSSSIYSVIAGFWATPSSASDEIFFNGFQGC